MADTDIVQAIAGARVDARSLSEFMYKPASDMVTRRLAPPINTLNYYLDRFDSINATYSALITTAQQSVINANALIANNAANATNAVNAAIEGVAIDANLINDALVVTVPIAPDAISRNQADKNRYNASPFDFGVVGDGLADDTEAVRAYHNYCNTQNLAADYKGIEQLAIQADAKIIINTDVNFRGVPTYVLGDQYPSGTGYQYPLNEMYIVNDELTPLVTVTGDMQVDANKASSRQPLQGLFDGDGFALLTAPNTKIPARSVGGELLNYKQSFHCIKGSFVTHPLSMDVDGSGVIVDYRENSARGRLTLSNPCLVDDAKWHRQAFIKITRNKVTLKDFNINSVIENPRRAVHALIHAYNVSEFEFDGYSGKALFAASGDGTYIFRADGCAELFINNVHTKNGWGWIGTNFVNGIYVTNSHVARIDGHESFHNCFVSNTTFTERGVFVGWGGGVVSMNNITLQDSRAFSSRGDYGGWFAGDIIITNVNITRFTYGNAVVLLENTGQSGFDLFTLPSANHVIVKNITLGESVKTNTHAFSPVTFSNYANRNIYAPKSIIVDTVTGDYSHDVRVVAEYGKAIVRHPDFVHNMHVSNIAVGKLVVDTSTANGTLEALPKVSIIIDNISCSNNGGFTFYSRTPISNLTVSKVNYIRDCIVPLDIVKGQGSKIHISNSYFKNIGATITIQTNKVGTPLTHGFTLDNCIFDGAYYLAPKNIRAFSRVTISDAVTLQASINKAKIWYGYNSDVAPEVVTTTP